MDIFYRGK